MPVVLLGMTFLNRLKIDNSSNSITLFTKWVQLTRISL
jgi:hypothetical protein